MGWVELTGGIASIVCMLFVALWVTSHALGWISNDPRDRLRDDWRRWERIQNGGREISGVWTVPDVAAKPPHEGAA